MKRVVSTPLAECMMSGRSAKSSMTVRIWGRGLVDLASFMTLIWSLCVSSICFSAFSPHSLWKLLPSMVLARFLIGSQALSMSTLGEET